MPQIPIIQARQPLQPSHIQAQDFPIAPPSAFGAGIGRELQQSGEVFQRIQSGYDAVEIERIKGQGADNLNNVLTEAKLKISDPVKYEEFTRQGIQSAYDASIQEAENINPRVARMVQADLNQHRAKAEKLAQFGVFEKKRDVALSDALEIENRLADQAIANPGAREYASAEYGAMIGRLKSANFLDADKAQARMEKFNDRIIGDGLALYAQKNPLEFGENLDQGQINELYPGANATQIQRAVEIADRTVSLRESRARLQLAEDSKNVKNQMYQDAENRDPARPLTDAQIDSAGKLYAWPQDTINELKRINGGLKLDSPYKEQLIADAMESVVKVNPTHADVDLAADRLRSLAGRGQISADSQEYRAAMARLKSEKNRLTMQGDIRQNQAQRDAHYLYSQDRTRASDMLNRELPEDVEAGRRKKLLAEIYGQLDGMRNDPAGRTKYLGNVEKQIRDNRKQRQDFKPKIDGLRSMDKK